MLLREDGLRCGIGFLPGPPDLWVGSWITVAVTPVFAVILKFGFFSVGMLVKWVAFLLFLHWPADGCDLGVGGVSFVELLILYEIWAGERLELEKAVLRYRRPGRSISVSAVPFGPGTDIWRSCRFIGALFRGLRDLPLGLRRFVPCDIGANHCRLRHIGWERCGHGLTSRPRESASRTFLTCFWSCSVIWMGLLLLCWLVFYPFGIVLPGLLVNFPLGSFLTRVMFVSWLLMVLLVLGSLMVMGFVVFRCLALLVLQGLEETEGFWGSLVFYL